MEYVYPSRSSHAHPVSHTDCTGLGQTPILESDTATGGITCADWSGLGHVSLTSYGKLGTAEPGDGRMDSGEQKLMLLYPRLSKNLGRDLRF